MSSKSSHTNYKFNNSIQRSILQSNAKENKAENSLSVHKFEDDWRQESGS